MTAGPSGTLNVNTETTDAIATAEEKQKLNLAVDIKEKSACERHITVTVPREDIERYFTKQFDDLVPVSYTHLTLPTKA